MTDTPGGTKRPKPRPDRRTLHATCSVCAGCRGFTNLVVSKRDGEIVLDPHATGACVISLAEDSARVLRDLLTEWLG